jgi:hypothetical protein
MFIKVLKAIYFAFIVLFLLAIACCALIPSLGMGDAVIPLFIVFVLLVVVTAIISNFLGESKTEHSLRVFDLIAHLLFFWRW